MNIIFQAITSLTGGLINDLTTAIVGMLVLGFICMGIDYLKDVFENAVHTSGTNKALKDARSYKALANSMDDDVSRDYLNAKYHNAIRRAAK